MYIYYVEKCSTGFLELRQTRFRSQRQSRKGQGHPHDVCAVARDLNEMRSLTELLEGSVDWEGAK